MRRYETIIVLRPDLIEAPLKEALKRFESVVATDGGQLLLTEEWGTREMAYRIRREHRGQYFRLDYVASAATVNELERNLKLSDAVLRFLSVVTDTSPDLAKLKEQAQARQTEAAQAQSAAETAAVARDESQPPASEAEAQPREQESSVANESGVEQN